MAIENFDHGATKAAGIVTIGDDADSCSVEAIGISAMQRRGTGSVVLSLLERIGQDELHAICPRVDAPGSTKVTWLTSSTVQVDVFDAAGSAQNGRFEFVFRSLVLQTVAPITNGPPVVEEMNLYVDPNDGDDSNPGTQALPLRTLLEAESRIPLTVSVPTFIHLRSASYLLPDRGYFLRSRTLNARLRIYADEAWDPNVFQVVATGTADAGTDASMITGVGFAVDDFVNETIEMTSGPAIGERRRVRNNTATEIIPVEAFLVAPNPGDTWRIINPLALLVSPPTSPAPGSIYVFAQDFLSAPDVLSLIPPVDQTPRAALEIVGFRMANDPGGAYSQMLVGSGLLREMGIDLVDNGGTALDCLSLDGTEVDVGHSANDRLWLGWGQRSRYHGFASKRPIVWNGYFSGNVNGPSGPSSLADSYTAGDAITLMGGRCDTITINVGRQKVIVGIGSIPFLVETVLAQESVNLMGVQTAVDLYLANAQIDHIVANPFNCIRAAGDNTIAMTNAVTGGANVGAGLAVNMVNGAHLNLDGVPVFGGAADWAVPGLPNFGNGDFAAVGASQLSPDDGSLVTRLV